MDKLSDMGTHYFVEAAPIRPGGPKRRVRINRCLCLGGPAAGLLRSWDEIMDEGLAMLYRRYNAGDSARRGVRRRPHIFVHVELLGEKT